ncbi:MAG: acyl-CoA dehydrogenase family protein [Acidimicrobiales bacterium]
MRTTALGAGSDDLDSGRRYLHAAADGGWAVPAWPRGLGGRDADAEEVREPSGVGEVFRPARPLRVLGGSGRGRAHAAGPRHRGAAAALGCPPSPTARRSGARCSPNPRPAPIWPTWPCGPSAGDGDTWRLEGQKVWTSRGMWATWGLCLARTDPDVPKHNGLTMFALRMDDPVVEVCPSCR